MKTHAATKASNTITDNSTLHYTAKDYKSPEDIFRMTSTNYYEQHKPPKQIH